MAKKTKRKSPVKTTETVGYVVGTFLNEAVDRVSQEADTGDMYLQPNEKAALKVLSDVSEEYGDAITEGEYTVYKVTVTKHKVYKYKPAAMEEV